MYYGQSNSSATTLGAAKDLLSKAGPEETNPERQPITSDEAGSCSVSLTRFFKHEDLDDEVTPITLWIGDELSVGYWKDDVLHRRLRPALVCGEMREWWMNGRNITCAVEAWIIDHGYAFDPEEWNDVTKVFWLLRFSN